MKVKEEKCNELFSLEKEVKDKKKKKPLKKIIAIILSVIILAGIVVFAILQINYVKNKNFTNGIQGKYYCTETLSLDGFNQSASQSLTDEYFLGESISVDENGVLSGLFVLDYDPQLKFTGDYFNLDKNWLTYEPVEEDTSDYFINEVRFYKKGSYPKDDVKAETDQLVVFITLKGITDIGVNYKWPFILTFEKK